MWLHVILLAGQAHHQGHCAVVFYQTMRCTQAAPLLLCTMPLAHSLAQAAAICIVSMAYVEDHHLMPLLLTSASLKYSPPGFPRKRASGRRPKSRTTCKRKAAGCSGAGAGKVWRVYLYPKAACLPSMSSTASARLVAWAICAVGAVHC
jgi:hypothetical protein